MIFLLTRDMLGIITAQQSSLVADAAPACFQPWIRS